MGFLLDFSDVEVSGCVSFVDEVFYIGNGRVVMKISLFVDEIDMNIRSFIEDFERVF